MNTKLILIALAMGLSLNASAMIQPISEEKLKSLRSEFYSSIANQRWDRAEDLIKQLQEAERAITARDWKKALEQAKKTIKEEEAAQVRLAKHMEEMAHRKAKIESEQEAKKKAEAQIPSLASMPDEVKKIIMDYLIANYGTPETIGKAVRSLQINPKWSAYINTEKFTQEIVNYMAKLFVIGQDKLHEGYVLIGTPAAEKLIASYIQANKGNNKILADYGDLLLYSKDRWNAPARAVELAARAIRAMDPKAVDFPPDYFVGIIHAAHKGTYTELYPLLADKLLEATINTNNLELTGRTINALAILINAIEESKLDTLVERVHKLQTRLDELTEKRRQ